MLLDIMSFARDISRDDSPRRELDTRRLSFSGVRLLGSHDTDSQTDTLQRWAIGIRQGGRDRVTSSLALSNAAEDLIECCAVRRRR